MSTHKRRHVPRRRTRLGHQRRVVGVGAHHGGRRVRALRHQGQRGVVPARLIPPHLCRLCEAPRRGNTMATYTITTDDSDIARVLVAITAFLQKEPGNNHDEANDALNAVISTLCQIVEAEPHFRTNYDIRECTRVLVGQAAYILAQHSLPNFPNEQIGEIATKTQRILENAISRAARQPKANNL